MPNSILTTRTTLLPTLIIMLLMAGCYGFVASPASAGTNGQFGIDRVNLHPPGSWRLTSGIRWEHKRTLTKGNDYDNLRVQGLDISYSLNKRFQFNGQVSYSSNSGERGNFPNEAGVEAVNLATKVRWNRNIGTVFTVGSSVNDDVFPYGGDGFQGGVNFPAQFSMGPGTILVEAGYTINNGDAQVPGGIVEWNNYFNYGLGYYYELTDRLQVSGEIVGHGKTIDAEQTKDFLEAVLKPGILLSETSLLTSSLSVGMSEGSPNFGVGLNYTYRIGGTRTRRVAITEEDIGSRDFGSITKTEPPQETPERAKKRQRNQPLVLPGELEAQTKTDTSDRKQTDRDTGPKRNPGKAQQLANRAREAFEEDGNLDRAIQFYKRAVKYDPRNVEILSNLGSLLYRKDNYSEAKKYYQRALQADPEDQFSHLYLGITYYQLEEFEKAKKHLKRAESINPNNRTARRARQWLNRINDRD